MKELIAAEGSVTSFFDEAVRRAAETRGRDPNAAATRYLVGLLEGYARPGTEDHAAFHRPLTLLYREALESVGPERFRRLRGLGDDALYLSGFFVDHLERRGVALGFVENLGANAYDAASAMLRRAGQSTAGPDVFDELASNFGKMVELLRDVADAVYAMSARDPRGVLDLYERWTRRGSHALAKALVDSGVVPVKKSGLLH